MIFLKRILPAAVLLVCAYFLVVYVRDHLSEFSNLSDISIYYITVISILYLCFLAGNGLFLKIVIVDFGIDLNFSEYYSLSVITGFGNIFLPMRGGAGFRAVYLKSKYNFDYSYFVSSLAGNYLISFNITSLTALAGLVAFHSGGGDFNYPAAAVFFALTAATSWAIFLPPSSMNWLPVAWVRERANQILSGWQIIRKSRRTVLRLIGVSVANILTSAAITWAEFAAFGMNDTSGSSIGFVQSLIFTTIGGLSMFVGITPAALGIRESLLMFSSNFLGISPAQALAVSLLDRSVNFLVLGICFCFASVYIKKQLRFKDSQA